MRNTQTLPTPTRRLPWPTRPTTSNSPAITTRRPARPDIAGILRRAYDAFQASRQRKADREVAAYIERSAATSPTGRTRADGNALALRARRVAPVGEGGFDDNSNHAGDCVPRQRRRYSRTHPRGSGPIDLGCLPRNAGARAARRRLARSIAHLDDRLLADAGLTGEQRGLGHRLIRHFAAASAIWSGANARGS